MGVKVIVYRLAKKYKNSRLALESDNAIMMKRFELSNSKMI